MNAHVLLNLLNELRKRDKVQGLIKNTLKSHFRRKNVIMLSICTQRYGHHYVSRKSINH